MVGVAIHSWDDFKFLKKIKLDFIKILGSSFGDYNYLKKVKSLKLVRFLSTYGKSITQVMLLKEQIIKLQYFYL